MRSFECIKHLRPFQYASKRSSHSPSILTFNVWTRLVQVLPAMASTHKPPWGPLHVVPAENQWGNTQNDNYTKRFILKTFENPVNSLPLKPLKDIERLLENNCNKVNVLKPYIIYYDLAAIWWYIQLSSLTRHSQNTRASAANLLNRFHCIKVKTLVISIQSTIPSAHLCCKSWIQQGAWFSKSS